MIPTITPATNYEADMTELLQLTGSLQDVRAQLEPSRRNTTRRRNSCSSPHRCAIAPRRRARGGEPFGLSEASA